MDFIKHTCLLSILLFAVGCGNKKPSVSKDAASRFNFEAVYDYWEVVDSLKNSQYPSDVLWDKLLNHQGYKVIESANGTTPEMIKERLSICFYPENKKTKDSIFRYGDVFQKSMYSHLIETDRSREALKKHINWMRGQEVYEAMIDKTNEFLPEKYKNYKTPIINIILFGENAHANQSGVCMDLLLSYFIDKIDKGGTLGHELHHYVLDSYKTNSAKERNKTLDKTKELVQKIVYQSQKEGIADLIDKERGYLNPKVKTTSPEYLTFIRSEFANGKMRISQLNKKLVTISQNKNKTYTWDFVSEALPFYGHVVGFYMAKTINENGYHKELINTINRPQCFFELYNKVVQEKKLDAPLFDEVVIQLINESSSQENTAFCYK
ncbi:DUF5700 domain-containing putative Zn-dependent protease [Aquimarina aquimarini]|uniref:DUF5700 domain-containing putative Zn-dependent protease n=1 Tax=Aquimarina aquimarini TaxID=1191734 RepID=UPI000D551B9F|nr:DUF5700 domain-containing putative Zn-dependent protease [Aquimarina aquimarini]